MRERIARAMRRVPDDSPASAYELRTADAVLDALREPTEGMIEAAGGAHLNWADFVDAVLPSATEATVWQTMIDAAKEGA